MDENIIDENIVDFKDFGVEIDLREIENMDKEEVEECLKKVEEIKKILENG